MPANRFIHPRLGHSEKVNLLTDLEFRVWIQYMLSADDFGVLRFSAVNIQADNDALHQKTTKAIQRCLDRLVDLKLLVDYEHQGRKYLCQLDWHAWQRFNMPGRTINPAPPEELLVRCDDGTASLFYSHHPDLANAPQPQGLRSHQVDGVDAPSDVPQLTANGLRQTANGSLRERFADFWRCYPRKVGKDAAWKSWDRIKPSADLLAQMLAVLAWQKQQEAWVRDGGHYVPHPSTWLNQGRWQDEPREEPRLNRASVALGLAAQEFLKS